LQWQVSILKAWRETAEFRVLTRLLSKLAGRSSAVGPVPLTATVSIGMAAHGNSQTTAKALDALLSSATGDFELVLVDDFSPDDTLGVYLEARRLHSNTRIFSFGRNLEYCQSVNAFLSHARGDCLIFLSNDVMVCPAYLRELLAAAAGDPAYGILRGCSNYVDGDLPLHNVAVGKLETMNELFSFGAERSRAYSGVGVVDARFLVGDAFLVKRAVIERIGTFDTRFFGYYCDPDYSVRAKAAGFRTGLVQSAFAFHDQHANIRYLPAAEQQRKLEQRHARVSQALGAFMHKYGIRMNEASIHDIPWEALTGQPFDPSLHFTAPMDYSPYLVD
jgi:hypothetical protein